MAKRSAAMQKARRSSYGDESKKKAPRFIAQSQQNHPVPQGRSEISATIHR
jgi:hypothetical protein